jgi:hypothetical protein
LDALLLDLPGTYDAKNSVGVKSLTPEVCRQNTWLKAVIAIAE